MTVAVRGAVIVREYEGLYENKIVYKRRCDACGYLLASPVCASVYLYGDLVYGPYHKDTFVCPFCENLQRVELRA